MSNTESQRPTIDAHELATRRDDDALFVLDVRREAEYEEWHVDGSHNLPIYDELLENDLSGLEAALDDIPADREIAVVCVAGITSADAAAFLRDREYDARSLEDGMNGWGRVHVAYELDDKAAASDDTATVDGITQIVRPGTGCVSYLVEADGRGVVVDPSLYVERYHEIADARDVELVGAIDTHAHADHVSGGRIMAKEWDVPYYLHPEDAGELDDFASIEDGDRVSVGDRSLGVLHTPGHTPGSVSLRWGDALLSGDTLFIRGVGRPDLEGTNEADVRTAADELYESLDELATCNDETVVLPGHMSDEEIRPLATTIDELRASNELFGMDARDRFVQTIVDGLSDEPANYNQIKAINWGEEALSEEAQSLELGPNNCAAN